MHLFILLPYIAPSAAKKSSSASNVNNGISVSPIKGSNKKMDPQSGAPRSKKPVEMAVKRNEKRESAKEAYRKQMTIDCIPYGHRIGNDHRQCRTIRTRRHLIDVILSPIGTYMVNIRKCSYDLLFCWYERFLVYVLIVLLCCTSLVLILPTSLLLLNWPFGYICQ